MDIDRKLSSCFKVLEKARIKKKKSTKKLWGFLKQRILQKLGELITRDFMMKSEKF